MLKFQIQYALLYIQVEFQLSSNNDKFQSFIDHFPTHLSPCPYSRWQCQRFLQDCIQAEESLHGRWGRCIKPEPEIITLNQNPDMINQVPLDIKHWSGIRNTQFPLPYFLKMDPMFEQSIRCIRTGSMQHFGSWEIQRLY